MVREVKNSHATTKKISRRFSGKHAPQSDHLRFVFPTKLIRTKKEV
ncbi:DUF1661 domain-containing protein [Porphyromonas gingivalis]|nr:DUF1661 domain-containing protein [Porphyromonas gingivalis]